MNNSRIKISIIEFFTSKLPALSSFLLIVLMLLPSFSYADNSVIGKVVFTDGYNTIQQTDGYDTLQQKELTPRVLRVNDEISLTDLIKTVDDSVLIVSFNDGAKVTLRPNSTLYIKEYTETEATISLVRGGIRVIAGEIARRVPASFKVITPDGKITAQNKNSEFSVRICKQDCNEDNIELIRRNRDVVAVSNEWIEPGTHVSVEAGIISIVGPSDDPPIFVNANLSVSVEPMGIVSSLSSPSIFQAMDPYYPSSSIASRASINTIVIGRGSFGSTTDMLSGTTAVATVVIQEQTISSPY